MEFSSCSIEAPSRASMPGTPPGWLAAAWRDAAATGRPAAVLVRRDAVLLVAWVNAGLGELLGRDQGDLAGRALRELVEEAEGVESPNGVETPDAAELGVPGSGTVIGWARLAHRLVGTGGGSGVAALRLPDGADARVRLAVRPVDVPEQLGLGCQPSSRTEVPGAEVPGAEVPGAEVPRTDAPLAGLPRARGAMSRPGVVAELVPAAAPRCWLLTVDRVDDELAEAEAALAVAEHRFEALASCAPVGIFASEAGLRLGYVNDFFVRLTGVDATGLLGNAWLDAIHRDDLPAMYSAVQTVLTGTPVELTVRLSGLRGVQRWLQLRLAPTTTPARAAGFIGTAADVTERRSWEEHLTYQAHHDPLTGLANRRRLLEVLTEHLAGRRGRDREFAVLFLGLDGFKEVNAAHGHAVGDRLLVEVSRRLVKVARDADVVARAAGDEFVVVLSDVATEAEAEAAARRHLAALADPVRLGAVEVRLTASVGVAMPAGFDTPDSLLRAADRVMYEAKAAGPGLYRLAPAGPAREGR